MNSEQLLFVIGEINDELIVSAAPEQATHAFVAMPNAGRRLVFMIAVALLALSLMGAGVAAVIYGDSIQNWFEYHFNAVYHRPMSEEQVVLINHLTQDIGLSQTRGDVTVTIDSATVGDDNFFLLLRVEGLEFSKNYSYSFEDFSVEISPDPVKTTDGFSIFGLQYYGLDGDGSVLINMDYQYAGRNDSLEDIYPLEIHLMFQNLIQDTNRGLLAEGTWNFTFTLEHSQSLDTILLPDTEVMVFDMIQGKNIPILFNNMELTSTGFRFQMEETPGIALNIWVVLEDGTMIGHNGGAGTPSADDTKQNYSFQWQIPVTLHEVSAIQIEDTLIPVP